MSNKTRIALYVTGFLFTVLAVAMLALPSHVAGLAIVIGMVFGVGILGALNQNRPASQFTAFDR